MSGNGSALARDRRRISRQRKIVVGVVLTIGAGVLLLAAPDLTGPFVQDLPFLAGALLALFLGGILLGVGYGERDRTAER